MNLDSVSHNELSRLKNILQKNLQNCIHSPLYRQVDLGIKIATVDGRHTLFHINPEKLMIPASVIKVVVSGVSLIKFGPGHKFLTLIMTDGLIQSRILKGNLYLIGRGDPALMIEDLEQAARFINNDVDTVVGDVIYDDSYLDTESPRYPPNARHLYAPPGAITVNYNWIHLGLKKGPPVILWSIPET
jgi:D-alanyl-D-alanine carboxypeptidase